jgi:predicted dehydrogenase
MTGTHADGLFRSDRRIRLGIWGLGRGSSFYETCRFLNLDVVAGCDYNQHMRERFARTFADAYVTDNADDFLAREDVDAVLLATYCTEHAGDAIRCLQAGKHVLSEVTAFHTLAEGVRLVDTVEQTGLVYNLAENYPFTAANMWLARQWKQGLFGDLMYAEYEYVHECRSLCYTYIDGEPVIPGNQAHYWRSWLDCHYYNTHSLGPMMHITGLRPTRVVALPGAQRLPGYLMGGLLGMGGVTPSLISMSNGSVVRNLMGATTNDTHQQRLWGTKAAAEIIDGELRVRLGGAGGAPRHVIEPHWDALGELAAQTGHGGGDFWVLYHFVRQILEGEPAPFDVYSAADVTIPGILARRSALANGAPCDVPDLRDQAQRESCRDDHVAQERFDHVHGLFGAAGSDPLAQQFARTMRDLIGLSVTYRSYRDCHRVVADLQSPEEAVALADALIEALPQLQEVQRAARRIAEAYPTTVAARVLRELLELSDEGITSRADFAPALAAERADLAALGGPGG